MKTEGPFLTWTRAHPRLWKLIAYLLCLMFLTGLAALMSAVMREFTDPKTGELSPNWWLKPASLLVVVLFAWWRESKPRKH